MGYGPESSERVAHVLMVHRWEQLTFLHWRYPIDVVQRLLPGGLRVQSYDGAAWVGLVPFVMRVSRPPVPELPWATVFAETNVRTYVDDPRGGKAVWFFSLDAARLAAVVTARVAYGLPYCWAAMSVRSGGTSWYYDSVRRWPGPAPARCHLGVDVGTPYRPHELGELDHFLTARFVLINRAPRGLFRSSADHSPWSLHRAAVTHLDSDLLQAAGLQPRGESRWCTGRPASGCASASRDGSRLAAWSRDQAHPA